MSPLHIDSLQCSSYAATQTVEPVSMRDVGTEMTPIPSQEPSRTGTPMGATTPSRSPRSSTPTTPKRGAPASSPTDTAKVYEKDCQEKGGKPELSEKELKLKTRREIAALGMQLGKTSIASWASKEVESAPSPRNFDIEQKAEYEARAAAWEEAEKAKHMARYFIVFVLTCLILTYLIMIRALKLKVTAC